MSATCTCGAYNSISLRCTFLRIYFTPSLPLPYAQHAFIVDYQNLTTDTVLLSKPSPSIQDIDYHYKLINYYIHYLAIIREVLLFIMAGPCFLAVFFCYLWNPVLLSILHLATLYGLARGYKHGKTPGWEATKERHAILYTTLLTGIHEYALSFVAYQFIRECRRITSIQPWKGPSLQGTPTIEPRPSTPIDEVESLPGLLPGWETIEVSVGIQIHWLLQLLSYERANYLIKRRTLYFEGENVRWIRKNPEV